MRIENIRAGIVRGCDSFSADGHGFIEHFIPVGEFVGEVTKAYAVAVTDDGKSHSIILERSQLDRMAENAGNDMDPDAAERARQNWKRDFPGQAMLAAQDALRRGLCPDKPIATPANLIDDVSDAEIVIVSDGENYYSVRIGAGYTDGLGPDEALGVIAQALLVRGEPKLKYLKTHAQHAAEIARRYAVNPSDGREMDIKHQALRERLGFHDIPF